MIELLHQLFSAANEPAIIAGVLSSLFTGVFGYAAARHNAKGQIKAAELAAQPEMATALTAQVQVLFGEYATTIARLQNSLAKAELRAEALSAKLDEAEAKIDVLTQQLRVADLRQTFQPH